MDDPKIIRMYGQVVTAVCAFLLFLACLVAAFLRNNTDLINTLAGFVGGFASAAVTFYLGSSAGSQAKDETIAASGPVVPHP